MARLKEKYLNEVAPAMMQKFQYKSVMEIPRLEKVVINMGLGDTKDNAKGLDSAVSNLINSRAKPVITKAKSQ